jgi:hypothetical protein
MLGLFEQSNLSAGLSEGVGCGKTGEASADDDVGFHVVL